MVVLLPLTFGVVYYTAINNELMYTLNTHIVCLLSSIFYAGFPPIKLEDCHLLWLLTCCSVKTYPKLHHKKQ